MAVPRRLSVRRKVQVICSDAEMLTPIGMLLVAQSTSSFPNAGTFAALGGIIAAVRRKSAIGGWLFFFFWGLFVGCGLSIYQIASAWGQFRPTAWSNSAMYLWFITSVVPRELAILVSSAAAIMLLWTFEWRWVVALRAALIVYLCTGMVAIVIDHRYFPNLLGSAYASLIFPGFFVMYIRESRRVKKVFQTQDWSAALAL